MPGFCQQATGRPLSGQRGAVRALLAGEYCRMLQCCKGGRVVGPRAKGQGASRKGVVQGAVGMKFKSRLILSGYCRQGAV